MCARRIVSRYAMDRFNLYCGGMRSHWLCIPPQYKKHELSWIFIKKLILVELAVSRRPAGALTRQAPSLLCCWGGEATPATQKDVPMLYFDRQILYGEGFHD